MAQVVDEHYRKYQTSPFRAEHAKTLLQQLLSAMHHVHAHCSLIHRDVKLSNLLYKEEGSKGCLLKLCDFGLSRTYSNDYYYHSVRSDASQHNNNQQQQQHRHDVRLLTPNVVSLWYRAPELLLGAGSSYTQAIDMWAVGCVFAELVLGRPLLNGTTELQQVEQIFDVVGVPTVPSSIATTATVNVPTTAENNNNNNNNTTTISISHIHFNLMDLPWIRDGKVQVPRKSRRRILTLLGDVLTPAAMKILTQLLHLNHVQRWTAHQALTMTTYFTTELPRATEASKMPRFSIV
jgi:serine/threonine protein kinase